MDWTTIISALLAALIPTGGLLAIVTIKERKTALQIDNLQMHCLRHISVH